jgi:ribose transport system permease protein
VTRRRPVLLVLEAAPLLLFLAVLAAFGGLSDRFLQPANLLNVAVQASSLAIVAAGETLVLLTAGVDLSVGAVMFIAAALAGRLAQAGAPAAAVLAVIPAAGAAWGGLNALCVVGLRIPPFVATLATFFLGQGLALWICQTRAINFDSSYTALGAGTLAGVPVPILVLGAVLLIAHLGLTRTPSGRRVYAVGADAEAARKAGVRTGAVTAAIYIACGLCAGIGTILSLAQIATVSPTTGRGKEFEAIAAAVLGGTSLAGGRGKVFPGTLLGALTLKSVEAGLVILNADPYLYPMISSGVIFLIVLVDSARREVLAGMLRRRILPAEEDEARESAAKGAGR